MHGHRLRLQAERNYVHLWTDISVGAVYGAMKRLAAEGLLQESGREQLGNRPTRQLYEITTAGRQALATLRREALDEVWFKYDPFDLALTRIGADGLDALPAVLAARLEKLKALLAASRHSYAIARPHVGPAKQWALRHTEYRLEAEIAYLSDLLGAIGTIVAAERPPSNEGPAEAP